MTSSSGIMSRRHATLFRRATRVIVRIVGTIVVDFPKIRTVDSYDDFRTRSYRPRLPVLDRGEIGVASIVPSVYSRTGSDTAADVFRRNSFHRLDTVLLQRQ